MSQMKPENKELMSKIGINLYEGVYSSYSRDIMYKYSIRNTGTNTERYPGAYRLYYDGAWYNKRDYVLEITVVKDAPISSIKSIVMSALRKSGATNIITGTHNAISRKYMEFCFDEK